MILACPKCGSVKVKRDWRTGIYECRECRVNFDQPARIGKANKKSVAIWTTVVMVAITVFLMSLMYTTAVGMSPNIYLYAPREEKETLKLRVKGAITARIPFRNGIKSIVWDDLTLRAGKILTNGLKFDYLFYESEHEVPKHGDSGWVLRRQAGKTTWNGEPVDRIGLSEKFHDILSGYGFFENEIKDFIDEWLGEGQNFACMKLFFSKEEFKYGIFPISREELDRIFSIETMLEYPEYIRVQFLVKEIEEGEVLAEPVFPPITRSEYALHEWGVMKA